jgi:hypothetical protein
LLDVKAMSINKYSLWVASAVNMGVITVADLVNLADTSIAAALGVTGNDDGGGDDDGSGGDDGGGVSYGYGYYDDGGYYDDASYYAYNYNSNSSRRLSIADPSSITGDDATFKKSQGNYVL